MKTAFKFTLRHKEHGEVDVHVPAEDYDFLGQIEDALKQARKNAASRFVHYESFGGDSAYLGRLDEVAEEFSAVDVDVVGKSDDDTPVDLARYYVYGHYSSDDGGTWADHVLAINGDAAEFLARVTMANNEIATDEIGDSFISTMEDIDIYDCYREEVSRDDALDFIRRIAGMTETSDGEDAVLTINRLISDAREVAKKAALK